MFDHASSALQYVRSGAMHVYSVAAPRRLAAAPEIPTTDETGLARFHISVWHALWAPKEIPAGVIGTFNAAMRGALAHRVLRERLAEISQQIPTEAQQTPQALRTLHRGGDCEVVADHQGGQYLGAVGGIPRRLAREPRVGLRPRTAATSL
jgi:hypothetical protein